MDALYIKRHDIVRRYLLRQLSDQDEYEFEQYYFEHPEVLRALELERTLLAVAPDVDVPERLRDGEARLSWRTRLAAAFATPAWSLSATAAACALAALLLLPRVSGIQPGASPLVTEVQLLRVRGTPTTAPVAHIDGEGVVALSIDAAGLDRASLRGSLTGPAGSVEQLPLVPDPEFGLARLVVPTQSLPAGAYEVELTDAAGQRLAYRFEVVR